MVNKNLPVLNRNIFVLNIGIIFLHFDLWYSISVENQRIKTSVNSYLNSIFAMFYIKIIWKRK